MMSAADERGRATGSDDTFELPEDAEAADASKPIAGSAVGATVGGVIGAVVGGPGGAAVGAAVGGAIGAGTGAATDLAADVATPDADAAAAPVRDQRSGQG